MDILKLKIEQEKYNQIVVPQNFTKTLINNDKMITQQGSIFQGSGRKFPIRRYANKCEQSSYKIYASNNR